MRTNYNETLKTLQFGQKAKSIKTIVNINEIVQEAPDAIANKISQMTLEIEQLKAVIEQKEDQLDSIFDDLSEKKSDVDKNTYWMNTTITNKCTSTNYYTKFIGVKVLCFPIGYDK